MQRQLIEAVIGLVGPDASAQDLCVLRNQDVLLEPSVGGTEPGRQVRHRDVVPEFPVLAGRGVGPPQLHGAETPVVVLNGVSGRPHLVQSGDCVPGSHPGRRRCSS